MNKLFKYIVYLTKKCLRDDLPDRAASVSFYLLTSVFPFIVFMFIVASKISLSMLDTLVGYLHHLPKDVENLVISLITGTSQSTTLMITALAITVWSVSGAMVSMTKALNCFYNIKETRNFFAVRIKNVFYAVLITLSIVFCFIMIIFGGVIGRVFQAYVAVNARVIWNLARFAFIIGFVWLLFMFLYKVMPNKRIMWKNVALGSLATTGLWIGASWFFSLYVTYFSRFHIVYGSIAGVVMMIFWFYLTGIVILLGGEINSANEIIAEKGGFKKLFFPKK